MEREEQWIAKIRQTLQRSEEPLPVEGWEALRRDLAAAARRRAVFRSVWKRTAVAAAVIAIAVWIGETVADRGIAESDRKTAFPAEELASAADRLSLTGEDAVPADAPLLASAAGAARPAGETRPLPAGRSGAESRTARRSVRDAVAAKESASAAATGSERMSGTNGGSAAAPASATASESISGPAAEREEASGAARKAAASAPDRQASAQPRRAPLAGARADKTATRVFEPAKPARRRSIGLFAAGLPTAQHVSSGRATPMKAVHVISSSGIVRMKRGYDDYLYRHKQPLSFGISVRKEFAYGLSLESGLVYSLLRSDVRVSPDDESFSETLHMLGLPLKVNWSFLARRDWRLYLGAGGMVEKALYAKFGSESVAEKALQWSLGANAGVQYDFTRRTAVYFEPGISCYLTETDLRTARTASPVNLSLQLGLRLSY